MTASLAAFSKQANDLNDTIGKEFAKDKWMALAQAGFAMLAEKGTLAEGIGRGGQAGLAHLGQARDKRDEAQRYADEKSMAQQALALKAAQARSGGSGAGAAGDVPTLAIGDQNFLRGELDIAEARLEAVNQKIAGLKKPGMIFGKGDDPTLLKEEQLDLLTRIATLKASIQQGGAGRGYDAGFGAKVEQGIVLAPSARQ